MNNISVKVVAASSEPKGFNNLFDPWVLLDDMPPLLRNAPSMTAFAELIGKPIEVDADSLGRPGPVRVKVWCRFPDRIRGFLEIYPHTQGFRINMRLEKSPTPSTPKTAASFKRDDKNNDDPKGDQSKNNVGNSSASPFLESTWNNMGSLARGLYPNRKPPQGG